MKCDYNSSIELPSLTILCMLKLLWNLNMMDGPKKVMISYVIEYSLKIVWFNII